MHLIWTQIEGEGKDVMREELEGGGGIQMEHSEERNICIHYASHYSYRGSSVFCHKLLWRG